VTSTSPSPGFTPWRRSAITHSAAVKPAVPIVIACRVEKGSGSASSQSDFKRAFCARPPQCVSPRPQPVTTMRSPGFHCGLSLASTTPARSMPGTIGQMRAIEPRPVIASASL
jgi:hypothetical protein